MNRLRIGSIPLTALQSYSGKGLVYVVLDTCDAPEVSAKIQEITDRSACLFRGPINQDLLTVAPFLVSVDEDLLNWLIATVWRQPWGIFVLSPSGFKIIHRHLRKFLVVKSPDGEPWYFRYYDPRVIPTFLSTSSSQELEEFFGPVTSYAFIDKQGNLQIAELSP